MPKGSWREFGDSFTSFAQSSKAIERVKKVEKVRVQRLRSGKAGKIVTIIRGLELEASELSALLKRLKTSLGTGGTIKGDALELQGDQVSMTLNFLTKEGYRPKQAGG